MLDSVLTLKNKTLALNYLNIFEYSRILNDPISKIILKGKIKLHPFHFSSTINIDPISDNILDAFTGYFFDIYSDNSASKYNGYFEYQNHMLSNSGKLAIDNLNYSLNSFKKNLKRNEDLIHLDLLYKANFNLLQDKISITNFLLKTKLGGKETTTLSLHNKLDLQIKKKSVNILSPKSKISLKINKLKLNIFSENWFDLIPTPIKKLTGLLSAKAKIVCNNDNKISVDAQTNVDNLLRIHRKAKY